MAKDFPADEFDSVTAVGGRHRAKRTLRSRLASFARYAGVTLALSGAGIIALNATSNGSDLGNLAAPSSQGLSEFNANGLGVTVIDATDKKGLASKVAVSLFDDGWNVLSAVNLNLPTPKDAAAQPVPAPTPSATAGIDSSKATVVYVTTDAAKAAANDVLKTIGTYKIVQAATYADPITIVLGSDYK
ncbi:MAG: hypothetical protein RIR34_385 [Actinomycetota bacterium]